MIGFISKMFGGSKSEKDVKQVTPIVEEINKSFSAFQTLSNDQLRGKTQEFRKKIQEHLSNIDKEITSVNKEAEELPFNDITGKDALYQQVDKLKKDRDKQIEEVLKEILPEAFAVVKETARRFKENAEIVVTATDLDKDLSVKKEHIRIEGDKAIFKNSWMAAGNLIRGTWCIMMCN